MKTWINIEKRNEALSNVLCLRLNMINHGYILTRICLSYLKSKPSSPRLICPPLIVTLRKCGDVMCKALVTSITRTNLCGGADSLNNSALWRFCENLRTFGFLAPCLPHGGLTLRPLAPRTQATTTNIRTESLNIVAGNLLVTCRKES